MAPQKKHKEPEVIVFEDPEAQYRNHKPETKHNDKVWLFRLINRIE